MAISIWIQVSENPVPAYAAFSNVASGPADLREIRVGIVHPTFTRAAYTLDHFYNFYEKYRNTPTGTPVTGDLEMLTSPVPNGPYLVYSDAPGSQPRIVEDKYIANLREHLKHFSSQVLVTEINDQAVHDAKIFRTDGSNAYDLLVLFHNEYLTQEEYDNLKKFVTVNGGTILEADANFMTVEVKYDKPSNSVTLVRGHSWVFDGKVASRDVSERWKEENNSWMGSTFLVQPTFEDVEFRNMPFGYQHVEEQNVTNQNAAILYDYGAYKPSDPGFSAKVASYEMDSGAGKVVVLGFFGYRAENSKLWNFYDDILLPHALSPRTNVAFGNTEYKVYLQLKTGNVVDIEADVYNKNLIITLPHGSSTGDSLAIVMPNSLVRLITRERGDIHVMYDTNELPFKKATYYDETTLSLSIPPDISHVLVVPEFESLSTMLAAFAVLIMMMTILEKTDTASLGNKN